jgi:hypothetical protein
MVLTPMNLQEHYARLVNNYCPKIEPERSIVTTRAFKHSSSNIWSNLPVFIPGRNSVDNFKHKLKTHLFK